MKLTSKRALLVGGLAVALAGCTNKAPNPNDPTLKQNVLEKQGGQSGGKEISTTPPKAPPAGK